MSDYVTYYRISPGGRRKAASELRADVDSQMDNILGLDAQRADVARFLRGATPLAEFTEIESGKGHVNRPRLMAAIDECKRTGATLVIAKLDRLARNVAFIANLMESSVKFTALDLPDANEFTIHIFAAVAQNERKTISARVKAALAVIRVRGGKGEIIGHDCDGKPLMKLGNPRLREAQEKAWKTKKGKGTAVPPETRMLIQEWRKQGLSLPKIATRLNEKGVRSATGGKWYPSSVRNQVMKIEQEETK